MTEHAEQLRSTLVELHHQLAIQREITPDLRALLAGLAADIERILSEQGQGLEPSQPVATSQAHQRESLIARLTDAARQFEETHPTLSGTIGGAIDALGRMGI